jgi:hypothetical protein
MARKSAKKITARKSSKSATTTKGRPSSRTAAANKPARVGGTHVSFGVHGMTSIVKAIGEAGLESEFNEHLRHDDKFVKVQRKSLAKIREFVTSRPELAYLADRIQRCDCDPSDPYCIYI